ncbi:NUDIX hydrolase [Methanoregula sp.]|jgi:ADP-ribose pyrophosphatase|uniref:NUDIX hydrolase n=1 Tax=Methanoregula sp. TaxID=2052170 RepID=UPI0025FF63A1|nr:NUDIX hydrolase [Methanoregula sp.]
MEIYRGRRLWIEKSVARFPNGIEAEKVTVHPGSAVAILPVTPTGYKLLRQYRYAVGQYIYEAPAGTMEDGEDPLETAHRELIEEAGVAATTMIPKGFIYTTPGYTDEKIYLFEARGLSPSHEYEKDADEVIEVMDVTKDRIDAMVRNGTICDAKTICLIHRCMETA